MIERRQIDHIDLVQLGKMLLLLRQELLVDLPSMIQTTEEIVTTRKNHTGINYPLT